MIWSSLPIVKHFRKCLDILYYVCPEEPQNDDVEGGGVEEREKKNYILIQKRSDVFPLVTQEIPNLIHSLTIVQCVRLK